jgi:type III secretion protein V
MNSSFVQGMNRFLLQVQNRQDIVFAMFFLLIVAMLIMPFPPILIDTMIAINLGIGLLILLTATYLRHALDLSTFPTIVLITTVYRLALSVTSTRMILSEAHAGDIIAGFGNFVVAGNVVVGLVIFFIVAIVQFIVITKGAERIAEVSARFTLDALPGKQMSIDADLRNGDIDRIEARRRRSLLEKESQFFGAMDGSMRFVKGDAIAGFVIVFVNLIGGLIIGVAQKGMSFSEAGQLYSLLTVGDGLVSQIPAMFISIAAGAVVTRVNAEDSKHVAADMARQLGFEPKALALCSAGLFAMGLLPGFPTVVFFSLALFLAALAAFGFTQRTAAEDAQGAAAGTAAGAAGAAGGADAPGEEGTQPLNPSDRFDIFTARVHPATKEDLEANRFSVIYAEAHRELVQMLGFEIRPLGFQADVSVPVNEVVMDVEGVPVRTMSINKGLCRVTADPRAIAERGIALVDVDHKEGNNIRPWVSIDEFDRLTGEGLTCVGPLSALAEDLTQEMRNRAARAFSINDATQWLQQMEAPLGRLVSDMSQQVPLMRTIDIMRRMLDEQIFLRQPRILLETMLTWAPREQDNEKLIDAIRAAMRRQINYALAGPNMVIPIIMIEPRLEEMLKAPPGTRGVPPDIRVRTAAAIRIPALRAQQLGIAPALIVSKPARRFFRDMLLANHIHLPVMNTGDIDRDFSTHVLDVVDTEKAMSALPTEDEAA